MLVLEITTTRLGVRPGKVMVATMAKIRVVWGQLWRDTMTICLKRVGRADKRVASIT